MWEEWVCIYGTPGVHNNFPENRELEHFPSERNTSEGEIINWYLGRSDLAQDT